MLRSYRSEFLLRMFGTAFRVEPWGFKRELRLLQVLGCMQVLQSHQYSGFRQRVQLLESLLSSFCTYSTRDGTLNPKLLELLKTVSGI